MNESKVLIAALRRSGTTILWESFRTDKESLCFDEPFHPLLSPQAKNNDKGTWDEFIRIFQDQSIAKKIRAISPGQELEKGFSREELNYLKALFNKAPNVVVDVVRCWNKFPIIDLNINNLLCIHLVRDPIGWVTGHLLPSGKGTWKKKYANLYREFSFFTRRSFYNNYHYQYIIESAIEKKSDIWSYITMEPEHLKFMPAYTKLLAFWWCSNIEMHKGLYASNSTTITSTLSEFSRTPERVMKKVSKFTSRPTNYYDLSKVSYVRPGYKYESPKWGKAAKQLGIPVSVLDPDTSPEVLAHIFENAINIRHV